MKLGKSQREKDVVRVASVAAYRYGQLLFGRRKDNGRWTLPGGHLEPNEAPAKGAIRELLEEANLKPKKLEFLGEETIEGRDGTKIQVFSFRADIGGGEASGKNDPDDECGDSWRWVSPKSIPDEIMSNLHSRKNVTLKLLGLQKSVLDPAAGYTFEATSWAHRDGASHKLRVSAFGPDGTPAGSAELTHCNDAGQGCAADVGTHLFPSYVEVSRAHRRQGVASAMYAHAEKVTGKKIRPSSVQSPDARAMWAANDQQKQFGKSEDDLAKMAVLDPNAGYTFTHRFEEEHPANSHRCSGVTKIVAFHPSHTIVGEQYPVGHATLSHPTDAPNELRVAGVWVREEHRRNGLASAMYALAEQHTGKKVVPSALQSDDAKALWAANDQQKQFGKSEDDLAKMAIRDLQPGAHISTRDAGREGLSHNYNYSHLLPPAALAAGYHMTVTKTGESDLDACVYHGATSATKVGFAYATLDPALDEHGVAGNRGLIRELCIHHAKVKEKHQGQKLGQAAYEALMTHAFHVEGINKISGGIHSSLASRTHAQLSDKHGMDYVAEPSHADNPNLPHARSQGSDAPHYDSEGAWMDEPAAPYDNKFDSYRYTLKDEMPMAKMAIKDLVPGRRISETGGQKVYACDHLLPLGAVRDGYSMTVTHTAATHKVHARVFHNDEECKREVGFAEAYLREPGTVMNRGPMKTLHIGHTHVNGEHQNRRLGQAAYEALMTHAFHVEGAQMVTGGEHSTLASASHRRMSGLHGMDYKPEPNHGGNPNLEDKYGAPYVNETEWRNAPSEGYDGKYAPYRYTIKDEMAMSKSEEPYEGDEASWPIVDAGITPEQALEHELLRKIR